MRARSPQFQSKVDSPRVGDFVSSTRRMFLLVLTLVLLCAGIFAKPSKAQEEADGRRIIDVHLHALPLDFIPSQADSLLGYKRPESDEALMRQTIEQLQRVGVEKAITSGPPELLKEYKQAAPDRIIRSQWVPIGLTGDSLRTYLDSLSVWYEEGRFQVLGEVLTQQSGIAPNDSVLSPLWSFAEQKEVPVGIHINDHPRACPDSISDGCTPLALKEVLAEHPDLKVYIMHAGYPHLDDMTRLMDAYSHVYVGATFSNPKSEEYVRYLKGLVETGYGDRIMFGSDQMVWPELIGDFVSTIESADFLTEKQKRAIFYENAARFFGFDEDTSGGS